MPALEQLEEFNRELIKLGNEPQIAMKRGEEIERVMTPEEYPLDVVGPTLKTNRAPSTSSETPAKGGKAAAASSSTDDFLSSLDPDLFSGSSEPEAPKKSAPDLDDLFASDDTPAEPEKPAGAGFDDLFDDDLLSGIKPASGEPPGAENESPANFDDLFGDSSGAAETASGVPGDAQTDDFSSPDLGDMGDLGDISAEEGETATGDLEPGDTGQEADDGAFDDFLSDFGSDAATRDEDTSVDDNLPETGTSGGDEDALGDLGDLSATDFDVPADMDFGDAESDEKPTRDKGKGAKADSGDDFGDLGDLGDFSDADSTTGDALDLDAGDLETGAEPTEGEALGDLDSGDDFGVPDNLFGDAGLDLGDDVSSGGGSEAADDLGSFDSGDDASAADAIPDATDVANDLAGDFGTDDFSDEFDMGDFGKDFGVMEDVVEKDWNKPSAKDAGKPAVVQEAEEEIARATAEDEAKEFQLSPEDFRHLQESLQVMPLNLKIATEEAIGDPNANFELIKPIILALVRGESPRDIAPIVSRATGKRIKIPAGYERKTGTAFEQERNSFAYRFRENFLPLLRVVTLSAVAVGLLIYVAVEWIYRPIYGNSLYDQGIAAIKEQEYVQGNQLFEKAYATWPDNNRYLQYATTFREMHQNGFARKKYEELLGLPDPTRAPEGKDRMHRQGILDFADFAAYTQRDYNSSVNYLQRLIDVNKFDHQPVIAQGDAFLEWARYVEPTDNVRLQVRAPYRDSTGKFQLPVDEFEGPQPLYEAARYDYASLISKEGQTDELLSRMLRYFMRTGKEDEVDKIRKLFVADKEAKPDPVTIAELAGHIIDKAEGNIRFMDDAFELSVRAMEAGPVAEHEPALHYQLARYYRYLKNEQKETEALDWANKFFKERSDQRPLDRFELGQNIDSLIRKGETLYGPLYNRADYINGRIVLEQARAAYEQALQSRLLRNKSSTYGRVYAKLGDILYYEGYKEGEELPDYEGAIRQYNIARQHQYGVPPDGLELLNPHPPLSELAAANQDVSYKVGVSLYQLGNRLPIGSGDRARFYDQAALEFLQVEGKKPLDNPNLQFALGNAQFMRGNYDDSVGMYRLILDTLDSRKRDIGIDLVKDTDNRQRDIVEFMIKANNNLGASYYNMSQQGGRYAGDYLAQAQYYTGKAVELYDLSVSITSQGVADLSLKGPAPNLKAITTRQSPNSVYIYTGLMPDLQTTSSRPVYMTLPSAQ